MSSWLDVWHLVLAIVARAPPFGQIMYATGAVFVVVMALEGLRTSLLAMWRAHKPAPPLTAPPGGTTTLAMPAASPRSKSFSATGPSRFAVAASRRPKALTLSPRQFSSPRPRIRRHAMLEFAVESALHENSANAPMELHDAL